MRKLCTLAVSLVFSGVCVAADEPAAVAKAAPKATYAFGSEQMHKDSKVFWDGFLSGLRGFEHFYNPVGNPIYFETPFNNTGVRFLYLHHTFAEESQLQGGDLNVYALQARLAITERLGFIATKDGYSDLNADALPKENGWNNIAAGLKYAFYVDRETDFVARRRASATRWRMETKRFCRAACRNSARSSRLPRAGASFTLLAIWLIASRFQAAMMETPSCSGPRTLIMKLRRSHCQDLHRSLNSTDFHYLDNGTRTGLKVGGLDYTNLRSTDVSGSTVLWARSAQRWKLSPHRSVGTSMNMH